MSVLLNLVKGELKRDGHADLGTRESTRVVPTRARCVPFSNAVKICVIAWDGSGFVNAHGNQRYY